MTRLYDRIRGEVITDDLRAQILGDGKYQPVVFEITNVADYYDVHSGSYSELSDFPNVAPPFGCYWMEWRQGPNELSLPNRVGVMVLGTDGAGEPMPNDARWSIALILFIQGRGGRAVRLAHWVLLVDESGHINIHSEDVSKTWLDLVVPVPTRPEGTAPGDEDFEKSIAEARAEGDVQRLRDMYTEVRRARIEAERKVAELEAEFDHKAREVLAPHMREILHPVLLAHSLMACKNVEYEDHDPPERLSRKHQRKKGDPLVTFRTLLIRPMGGARQRSDKVDIGDGATAFHIVRGHFKTYTPDRPLFGQRIGTYWWSPTTRGDREHGEVIKDYSVVAGAGRGGS